MKKYLILWLIAAGMVFTPCLPAYAGDAADDARAVFEKGVEAAKAKNTPAFKSYIAKEDLREMERDGFVDLMMIMMADEDPILFTAEVKEDRVVFRKVTQESSPDGTSTGTTTITMIREGGQWKFGKPRTSP